MSPIGRSATTIVAICTPPGAALRGIVRLSGPDSLPLLRAVFRPDFPITTPPKRTIHHGQLTIPADADDRAADRNTSLAPPLTMPATAMIFPAPHSYTGETVVEIHTLGAPVLLAMITDALIAAGAQAAEPGEFTARAVANNRLEPAAVEGIAALIYARNDAQLRAARRQISGALAAFAADAREQLADLRALVEASLDFADEDIEFIEADALREKLTALADALRRTAGARERGEQLARMPRIVMFGRPNVGKSTLLNRLSGMDRALCAPLAGTTRDVLWAPIQLPDGEALLGDTAGIESRDIGHITHPESATLDERAVSNTITALATIDHAAIVARQAAIHDADLLLWVTAADEPALPAEVDSAAPLITVISKCDLDSPGEAPRSATMHNPSSPHDTICRVSAISGIGIDTLLKAMGDALRDSEAPQPDDSGLSAELRAALHDSVAAIDRALDLMTPADNALPHSLVLTHADVIAAELTVAAQSLGRIAGDMPPDEIYGRIYARFCVGK